MRYAAYGSNLHPVRLRRRTPSARLVGTDVLEGFELAWTKRGQDGSGKCTVREASWRRVHVAVFEIDPAEQRLLDIAEGLGAGYELETVVLPSMGACRTYLAHDDYMDDALRPFEWYRELVLVGARLHRFPPTYLDLIEATPATRDPDTGRRRDHEALIRAARQWEPTR